MPTIDQVLGYGLVQPFRFDGRDDFAAAGGVALVKASIEQILGTRAAAEGSSLAGELPWDDQFGARVDALRHMPNNESTQALARVWVADALARQEPRIRLTSVDFETRDSDAAHKRNVLFLRLHYDVLASPGAGNAVLAQGVVQTVAI